MQQNSKKFNFPAVIICTGLAFLLGGLFKSWLEWYLSKTIGSQGFFTIFIMIWFGFLVESAIGMTVLAFLLRKFYPFRKMWLAGTGAFALGIMIPALVINQFFYSLLILPGILVGLFFTLFLKGQQGKIYAFSMILLGFLVCHVLFFTINNDMSWVAWIYKHFGTWSVTVLMHMLQDVAIGVFTALGVGLMPRRSNS